MDIKATRFNLHRDSNDWKQFHHDAAGLNQIKPNTIFYYRYIFWFRTFCIF